MRESSRKFLEDLMKMGGVRRIIILRICPPHPVEGARVEGDRTICGRCGAEIPRFQNASDYYDVNDVKNDWVDVEEEIIHG